ncbi:MarR family winged helix-turn-helix transcriptional regulator [Bacillus marasmi]|uniref:MarR family winged helix-turn-helix transcriptional regulator n=1 Tax=Bacillus marasmi TaxID=1926279 RepID=UPI0011CA6ACB|nr:MarR family transcriptional regulator [Bacillus marasmi]
MYNSKIQELINRYIRVSFSVTKKAEFLIKDQIGSDLTYDQHYTLRYIRQKQNCTSTELAEIFAVNKSAVTAIITRLADKGLIDRTRDERDRRVVYLSLTDKGDALFNECEERVHQLVENIMTQFNDEEINSFINTYEKLEKLLDNAKEGRMTE